MNASLRIALIIDSLSIGGAQKYIQLVSQRLTREGHRVRVFCLNDNPHPKYTQAMKAAGVEVTTLGKARVVSGVGLVDLTFALFNWKADVVGVCLFVSTVVGRLVAGLMGIPCFTFIQARNINYSSCQRLLSRVTAPLSYFAVANSRSAIPFAIEHEGAPSRRIAYLPNLIEQPKRVGRRNWGVLGIDCRADCFVIGSLGRLVVQKGYDRLVEVAAVIVPKRPDVRFVVFGSGPEEDALRRLVARHALQRHFFLVGEHPDAEEWIESFDLYVQPSRFEGTPNALIEALLRDVRCCSTAVDGAVELGCVVYHNETELVHLIEEALSETRSGNEVATFSVSQRRSSHRWNPILPRHLIGNNQPLAEYFSLKDVFDQVH